MYEKVMELTENQRRVLPFLVAHPSITKACKEAQISTKTVYEWLHESPAFRQALKLRRAAVAEAAMDGLKARIERAVDTLAALLTAKGESVRRSAARDILDLSFRLKETHEIEERLDRMEKMIEARHAK